MGLFAKRKLTLGEFKAHLDRCIDNLTAQVYDLADRPPALAPELPFLQERRFAYRLIRQELEKVE